MLVSHRHKFIYTKTGKTGGTSVEVYFEPHCMRDGEWALSEQRPEYVSETGIIGCRGGPAYRKGAKWWNHMPAATMKEYLGAEVWDGYFKFCVVRNPFDRVVSAFHFFAREAGGVEPSKDLAVLREAFGAWLESGKMPIERDRYVIDGAFCMDDVIRYESMAEGLDRVSKRLGIASRPESLPRLKSGSRPKVPLEAYYSPRNIEIVKGLYAYELERFGYGVPF